MSFVEVFTSLVLNWRQKHDLARRLVTSFRICTSIAPSDINVAFTPVDVFDGGQFFSNRNSSPSVPRSPLTRTDSTRASISQPGQSELETSSRPFVRLRVTSPLWSDMTASTAALNDSILTRFHGDVTAWASALPTDIITTRDTLDAGAIAGAVVRGMDVEEDTTMGIILAPVVIDIRWLENNCWSIGGRLA
ncbi:hypothetical protein FRC02_012469 [Tulasnella sp. 418]|nr:hypothetical protein FRC02_012469 [Tulasnella sp. 418]